MTLKGNLEKTGSSDECYWSEPQKSLKRSNNVTGRESSKTTRKITMTVLNQQANIQSLKKKKKIQNTKWLNHIAWKTTPATGS